MSSESSTSPFLPEVGPYDLAPEAKCRFLHARLKALLEHHRDQCPEYRRIVDDWVRHHALKDVSAELYPALPVTIFKQYVLRSTSANAMTLQSSATTSGNASKILVDKETKKRQTISATRVLRDFLGPEPRPYLVFDIEKTVRGTRSLSARGAAIMSLAHLASEFHFVAHMVDGQLQLDPDALDTALRTIGARPFIAYGFTYLLYQMHQEIAHGSAPVPAGHPDSVLLHSGGWKRLVDLAVDKSTFNRTVADVWQLEHDRVIDFYGVIEQVGIPYPDCREGHKHVPYWADVVIRSSDTLAPAAQGETGLIQLISCLPLSAPNHSVLTEDLGAIVLLDHCPCGRRGKAFEFKGRAPRAEIRGCSDVARN